MLVEFPLLKNIYHFPLHNMYEKCFPTSPPTGALAHVLFPNLWHIFPLFSISPAPTLSFISTTLLYNPCSATIFTPSGLWNHNLASHCPPLCSPPQRSLCATHVRHWKCLLVSFPKLQRSQKFHRETVWTRVEWKQICYEFHKYLLWYIDTKIHVSCVCYIWWWRISMYFLPGRLGQKLVRPASRSKTGPFQPPLLRPTHSDVRVCSNV